MATVAAGFETIIGAYFDETERPFHELENIPEDGILAKRGRYVAMACDNSTLVDEISDYYGVKII